MPCFYQYCVSEIINEEEYTVNHSFKKTVQEHVKASKQRKRFAVIVAMLSVLIAVSVGVYLIQPATTMTTICGKTEHTHTSDCYGTVLTCGQGGVEGHEHTDACYSQVLTCGMEEHTHTSACYQETEVQPAPQPETPAPAAETGSPEPA